LTAWAVKVFGASFTPVAFALALVNGLFHITCGGALVVPSFPSLAGLGARLVFAEVLFFRRFESARAGVFVLAGAFVSCCLA
jgi:hypothetical protein